MGGLVIETVRPGVQFTPEAASAFRRAEAQVKSEFGRNIDANSTYRSWDTQMAMYAAWIRYVVGTGPYPGHSKAVHPSQSFHVSGLALDSDDWVNGRIVQILADNGFIRNRLHVPNERHHFEYIRSRDKNYGKPVTAGNSAPPKQTSPEDEEEGEEMAMKGATYPRAGKSVYLLFNEVSGFYVEHSGVVGDYNNSIAQKWETGSWPTITEAHATVIKRSLDAIRRTSVTGSLSVDMDG